MEQITNEKQKNYAFSVTIENTSTGESEVLQLPSTKEETKALFDRLKIKRRYRIKGCDHQIVQIRDAIDRSSNLDEINFCAHELLKCDADKIDFIWQILESQIDSVCSAAEVINLLNSAEYTFFRLSGVSTYEQVCEFHLAMEKIARFSPNHHIPKEKFSEIGEQLARSERGKFVCGNYIAKTRNYYPDIYYGDDSFPEEYHITP